MQIKEYGQRIRAYRKAKKMTAVELAKKIGISQGSLSDIENGKTQPSGDTLIALMTNTDISHSWLWAGVGEIIKLPVAPAIEVIGRIIKALYGEQFKADLKLGVKIEIIFSRYIDKIEKDLGLIPESLSVNHLNNAPADLPYYEIERLCIHRGISLDWVYTGEGEILRAKRAKSSSVDLDFLREIIETVEKVFQKEALHLSPRKKADLIALLYDELRDEPSSKALLKGKIIKLAKLAS